MPVKLQGILWPALGYPRVLEAGETQFDIVLSLAGCEAPDLARFQGWLRGPCDVPLHPLGAAVVPIASIRSIGRWAPWVARGAPWVVVIRVGLEPGCPSGLFDLEVECAGYHLRKPGSVAVRAPGAEFRVLVATDLHLATRWDDHQEGLARHYEEPARASGDPARFDMTEAFSRRTVLNSYVNPNANFRAFLQHVDELAARGGADALILSGDLVDFKFNRPRSEGGSGFADTSWKLIHDMLLGRGGAPRLRIPLFTCSGNHDYRLYPYRFRTYRMRHAGLPDEVSAPYLRARGEWGHTRYRLSDLDAVRIDTGAAHSLEYYFREFNPCLDYEVDLGGARFLFLDSGPDVVTNLRHLRSQRRGRFVQGLGNPASPHSDGLRDDQVEYLREWSGRAAGRAAVVISHAPLVFPPTQPESVLRLPPDADACAADFEQMLSRQKLDRRGLFANQLAVLQALRAHPGTALFLAGHCHTNAEMRLERATGHLRHIAGAAHAGEVGVLHTASLGHGHPAYRRLHFRDRELADSALVPLIHGLADAWSYDWRRLNEDEFELLLVCRVAQWAEECRHRLILHFTRQGADRLKVAPADPGAVLASHQGPAGPDSAYACWIVRSVQSFRVRLEGPGRRGRVAFLYETLREEERSGLAWHPQIFR